MFGGTVQQATAGTHPCSPLLTPGSLQTVGLLWLPSDGAVKPCRDCAQRGSVGGQLLPELSRSGLEKACQGSFQKKLTAYASLLTLGKLACQGGVGLPVNGRRTRVRYFSKGYAGTGVQDALHNGTACPAQIPSIRGTNCSLLVQTGPTNAISSYQ